MSSFNVNVTQIKNIQPHPDPETTSLEIATVYGWEVVVRKGVYSINQKVVYIPVDSVLSKSLEDKLFPPDSKIKLSNSRVKAIRIRKFVSQGMIVPLSELGLEEDIPLETDVSSKIGVSKYEPPENPNLVVEFKDKNGKTVKSKPYNNEFFDEYGGLTNIKNHNPYKEGELICVTEKIHGSNSRCGWLPNKPKTLLQKIKSFFGLFPKWQFCYGSNKVQLQGKKYTGFYNSNVYAKAAEMYDLASIMPKGYILYYEIYGPNIQKNYHYGLKKNEIDIVVFDVAKIEKDGTKRWLNYYEFIEFMFVLNSNSKKSIESAPLIYIGEFIDLKHLEQMTIGDSIFESSQKIREGIVIRNIKDYSYNRKARKMISANYLMKDNTDFH